MKKKVQKFIVSLDMVLAAPEIVLSWFDSEASNIKIKALLRHQLIYEVRDFSGYLDGEHKCDFDEYFKTLVTMMEGRVCQSDDKVFSQVPLFISELDILICSHKYMGSVESEIAFIRKVIEITKDGLFDQIDILDIAQYYRHTLKFSKKCAQAEEQFNLPVQFKSAFRFLN